MASTSSSAPYTTLISAEQLQALQASGKPLLVFDVSFDLMKPQAGAAQFTEGHIPGAVFADLDLSLSDKSGSGQAASGGRHPLPSREHFAAWLAKAGLQHGMQVVVYDRQQCNYCVRLWWMLKWVGFDAVAVLDGGLQAWQAAGGALETEAQVHAEGDFQLSVALTDLVDAQDVLAKLGSPVQTVIDARGAPRYRGEVEPLDPVAGHIPGALNRPFTSNFGADGKFKPAAVLRAEFDELLAGHDVAGVVHQLSLIHI